MPTWSGGDVQQGEEAGGAYQRDASQKGAFAAQGSGGIIYGFSPAKFSPVSD